MNVHKVNANYNGDICLFLLCCKQEMFLYLTDVELTDSIHTRLQGRKILCKQNNYIFKFKIRVTKNNIHQNKRNSFLLQQIHIPKHFVVSLVLLKRFFSSKNVNCVFCFQIVFSGQNFPFQSVPPKTSFFISTISLSS